MLETRFRTIRGTIETSSIRKTRFGRFIAESQVHQENSCGTFAVRYFRYSVIDFPSVRKLLFAIQPINYFDEFMESDGSINNCAV